jgi:cytochrome c1
MFGGLLGLTPCACAALMPLVQRAAKVSGVPSKATTWTAKASSVSAQPATRANQAEARARTVPPSTSAARAPRSTSCDLLRRRRAAGDRDVAAAAHQMQHARPLTAARCPAAPGTLTDSSKRQ